MKLFFQNHTPQLGNFTSAFCAVHDEITGGRKLSEYGAQSRFGYKGFSVGQSVFDCQAACFRMRRYERKNLILKVGEGNVSHLAGAEVRRQIGKLQLMAAVPGKQAAGQIVQLMNISGVRIFLQKAQKPFRKDPVAGHIGVVEKTEAESNSEDREYPPCVCGAGLSEALKYLKGEKVPAGRFLFLLFL